MNDTIITWLRENPYVWLILSIILFVRFIISSVGYIKERFEMQILYYSQSYLLAQNSSHFGECQIQYNSEKPNKITLTKYTIWNNKNKTRQAYDISKDRSISIYTSNDDVKILDAKIICCDESNCFDIKSVEDKKVTLSFDYIAKHDGVVVAILHTGNDNDLKFDYNLKNIALKVKKGSCDIGFAISSFFKILTCFLAFIQHKNANQGELSFEIYLALGILGLILIGGIIIFIVSFFRIPKRLRNTSAF